MSFNVGDKVRVSSPSWRYHYNKEYYVREVLPAGIRAKHSCSVLSCKGVTDMSAVTDEGFIIFADDYLELVKKYTPFEDFKVGDRVRVTNYTSDADAPFYVGKEGTVLSKGMYVVVDIPSRSCLPGVGSDFSHFTPNELEIIESTLSEGDKVFLRTKYGPYNHLFASVGTIKKVERGTKYPYTVEVASTIYLSEEEVERA